MRQLRALLLRASVVLGVVVAGVVLAALLAVLGVASAFVGGPALVELLGR